MMDSIDRAPIIVDYCNTDSSRSLVQIGRTTTTTVLLTIDTTVMLYSK